MDNKQKENAHEQFKEKRNKDNINLEKILDIEKDIEIEGFIGIKSCFSKVKFKDNYLENLYQIEKNQKRETIKNISENSNFIIDILMDSVCIFGYIISLLYLFIAYYSLLLISLCIFFKIISFMLVILSIKIKKTHSENKEKLINYIDHILIFLSSFNLNLKVFLINVIFIDKNNDYNDELIRVIIYQYLSTNIFLIVKLEADFKIFFIYFAKDLLFILLSQFCSLKNHFYHLEGLTSLSTYIIFFFFRKIWDLRIRCIFSEKFKFYNFYLYVNGLLDGIKGHHINIFDEKSISFNHKFSMFMNEKLNEVKPYTTLIKLLKSKKPSNTKIDEEIFGKMRLNFGKTMEKEDYSSGLKDLVNRLESENKIFIVNNKDYQNIHMEKEKLLEILNVNIFLKSFLIYDIKNRKINDDRKNLALDRKILNNYEINQSNIEEESKNENFIFDDHFLFDILRKKIYYDEVGQEEKIVDFDERIDRLGVFKLKINYDYINEIFLKINNQNEKINELESFIQQTERNQTIENKPKDHIFQKKDIYFNDSKDYIIKIEKSYTETRINKNLGKHQNKSFIQANILDDEKIFEKRNHNSSRYENYIKIPQKKEIKFEKTFQNTIEKSDKNEEIYYEVFLRRVKLSKGRVIYNLIFYDVTELIIEKNKILKEEFQKTRIFAKIAHEFKTPLNSILSILDKLYKENNTQNYNSTAKICESKSSGNHSKDISNRSSLYKKINMEDYNNIEENSPNFQLNLKKNYNCSPLILNKTNKKENILIAYNLLNTINFLVSDIITLSKFDDLNQLNVRVEYLNFEEVIFGINKILETLLYLSKAKQKRIKSEVIVSGNINFDLENQQFYKCDQFRVKQILYNFVSNAVKFTNVGKITINLKSLFYIDENDKDYKNTEIEENNKIFLDYISNIKSSEFKNDPHQKNKKYACISIKDTGIGINPERKNEIFNTDFEENYKINKIDDIFKINGFGLMICKQLAHLLNIEIGFKSEVNRGSNFFILIPQNDKAKKKSNLKNKSSKKVNFLKSLIDGNQSLRKLNGSKLEEIHQKKKSNNQFNIYEGDDSLLDQTKIISTNYKFLETSSVRLNYKFDCSSENKVTERHQNNLFFKIHTNNSRVNKGISYRFTNSTGNKCVDFTTKSKFNNSYIINNYNFEEINNEDSILYQENPKKIDQKSQKSRIDFKINNDFNPSQLFSDSKNVLIDKKYILVVDDNHLINDVNKKIADICFKSLIPHYEILQCTDGIDIIRYFLNEKINKNIILILTDENMEYLNGSDAIKLLRKLEENQFIKKIPCVSVTSHEDKVIVNRILECGADYVLSKPLTKNDLMNIIKILGLFLNEI